MVKSCTNEESKIIAVQLALAAAAQRLPHFVVYMYLLTASLVATGHALLKSIMAQIVDNRDRAS